MAFMAKRIHDAFRVFKEIDEDGSGSIDESEMRKAMALLEFPIYRNEFDVIWACLDEDGSGELDYTEFVTAVKEHEKDKVELEKESLHQLTSYTYDWS